MADSELILACATNSLADRMTLIVLCLQRMIVLHVIRLPTLLMTMTCFCVVLNMLFVLFNLSLVHLCQSRERHLDVCNQSITSLLREVLSDNDLVEVSKPVLA